MAVTLELQERDPAAHLLQTAIGFSPVYLFAEPSGEMRTVQALGDEALDELDIRSAEGAPAILHAQSIPKTNFVSSIILTVAITPPSPAPCSTEGPGARGRERMERLIRFRPPAEPSLRQPLLAEPVPLRVVGEIRRRAAFVAEDEQIAAEGVELKKLADRGEAVYPFSEVDRIHTHEDPHLGGDLDHGCQNCRLNSRRLTDVPLTHIFIFLPGFSISMVHSTVWIVASSIKAGGRFL